MFNIQCVKKQRKYRIPPGGGEAETRLWMQRVLAGGGDFNVNSLIYADNLVKGLRSQTFYSKIVWLNPLLGRGINAARVPLIDTLNVGSSTNFGFLDSDFSESVGLSNPAESAKYMDSLIKPSQLGTSNNGGLGWWEKNWGAGSGVEPIGAYNTTGTNNRYVIDGRSNLQGFRWGLPGNSAGDTSTFSNAHYYGQRSNAVLRSLFKNGSTLGVDNTTSDPTSGTNENNIYWMGCNEGPASYWKGRCAVTYMTDGTLTSLEVSTLNTLLNTLLISVTGR